MSGSATSPRVSIQTSLGSLLIELHASQAPLTVENFLRYVDAGIYDEISFYRAVRLDNDDRSPKIEVLQGGVDPTCRNAAFAPVPHESTAVTGLRHVDGALSAVRWQPGTATSEFFIAIGDTPELDSGGRRQPDGQGFAVFGRVLEGMGIVRRIIAGPTGTLNGIAFMKNQALIKPVAGQVARVLCHAE